MGRRPNGSSHGHGRAVAAVAPLILAAAALVACGGGGGGGNRIAVDDADGLTAAVSVAVGDDLASKVVGSPPAPSGSDVADAPIASADVASTSARAGDDVAIPLTVRSSSAIERLFAKIPGASSYFELNVAAGGKHWSAKAATTRKFAFSIRIPQNVASGQFCIELSVQDADARVSNVATVCLSVVSESAPTGNRPPAASAGDNRRELPGASVTLDGSASDDPDGTIVSYAWSQVQGPAVTLQNANTAIATFVAPQAEGVNLSFVLTVTDDSGAAGSGAVSILVTTEPQPPVVSFDNAAQSALESAGTVSVSLSISPTSDQDITLPFTVSGTADDSDRTVSASPLVIPAGAANAQILVNIADDSVNEADETVVLSLQPPTGAELGSQTEYTLTIGDNEGASAAQPTVFVVDEQYRLLRFTANTPQTFTAVDITGVEQTGVDNTFPLPLALERRPATGELYLYTSDRRFYRINATSGAATLVGTTDAQVATDFLLGIEFDPCTDSLRAAGDSGENFRFAADATFLARDTDFVYASGDANEGATPAVSDLANTSCVQGATTVYGIDGTLDVLVRLGSVGGSPAAASSGVLTTVADLSVSIGGAFANPFDIDDSAGIGYTLDGDGVNTTVYRVNLQTGELTNLGIIGDGSSDLRASVLAVQP